MVWNLQGRLSIYLLLSPNILVSNVLLPHIIGDHILQCYLMKFIFTFAANLMLSARIRLLIPILKNYDYNLLVHS